MPIGNLDILSDKSTEDLPTYEDPKNPEAKAHIVNPTSNPHLAKPGMTGQDVVNEARRRGIAIRALCGHTFVPKHNPDKLEACQICFDVAGMIMRENGE